MNTGKILKEFIYIKENYCNKCIHYSSGKCGLNKIAIKCWRVKGRKEK